MRLHIGAHKTGTTHLQTMLAARRREMAAAGLAFAPTPAMRDRLTPLIRDESVPIEDLRAMLGRLMSGGEVGVSSCEAVLGYSGHVYAPRFYERARRRVARLGAALGSTRTTLFLGIRSYDELVPSAYCQELRVRALPEFEVVRGNLAKTPRSWPDLIDRIRAAMPDAELKVWRMEDYVAAPGRFATLLTGLDLDWDAPQEAPGRTRSPSAEAVRIARGLPADLPREERRRRTAEIFEANPVGEGAPKFSPFSEAERAELRARYAADVEEIRRRHPGALIE